LEYRGPDDEGAWFDAEARIGLAHRRLSIIDLSECARQPMTSSDGRFVIVYNGEVYNFRELREALVSTGYAFTGHGDTEVLLAAIQCWGLDEALRRSIGMFAFALWDRRRRALSLVRDRMGIKPLYFGRVGPAVAFASELKAIRRIPWFSGEVDREALALYLRHGYVPAPRSIYRHIHKVEPGQVVTLDGSAWNEPAAKRRFWSFAEIVEEAFARPFRGSLEDGSTALKAALSDAVRQRLVSDVPLGAFFSGGLDSSIVVALMQEAASEPVQTFSIGSSRAEFDESWEAEAVARHLGTRHTSVEVTADDALAIVPDLPRIYDEPFADSSQIPTILVSRLTRRSVKVALSGDGGDEVFGGYRRYTIARELWRRVGWAPRWSRHAIARLLAATPSGLLERAFRRTRSSIERYGRPGSPEETLRKITRVLEQDGSQDLYVRLVSHWLDESPVLGLEREPTPFGRVIDERLPMEYIERMMFIDSLTYLPDDILAKVDRASMSVGLEARVPLLDHRVVGLAWSFPLEWKVGCGETKRVLRRVLERYVPRALTERPKRGFAIPMADWLRGPLRDWAEAQLDPRRLREEGYFRPGTVERKWREHIAGRADWHYQLWDVLMFQAWLEDARDDLSSDVVAEQAASRHGS